MASDGSRRNPVKTYVVCITSTGYALYHAVGLDPYQTNKDSFLQSVRGDLSSFQSVMALRDFHDFDSEADFCVEKRALSDPDELFDDAYVLGDFLHLRDYESVELGVFAPHITEFLREYADIPDCVFNEFYLEVSKCAGRNYDKFVYLYCPIRREELAQSRESYQQNLVKWSMISTKESHEGEERKMKKTKEEETHDKEAHNVKSEKKEKRKLAKCSHGRTSKSEKKEKKLQYRKEIAKRERSQQKLVKQGLMALVEESHEGKEKKMKKWKRKREEEGTHDKEVHNVKSEKKKKRKLAKSSHRRTSKSLKLEHS